MLKSDIDVIHDELNDLADDKEGYSIEERQVKALALIGMALCHTVNSIQSLDQEVDDLGEIVARVGKLN